MSSETDELGVKLPKEYAKLNESEFPLTINGIEYKTKQEIADRYKADLMAMAQLIYDIYQEKKKWLYASLSDSLTSANSDVIVGFPRVNFFTVRSSALLLAMRRLSSERSKFSFVFCSWAIDLSILSIAVLNFSDASR